MGLSVTSDDKGVKIFANEKETADGKKFTLYSVGVSSKNMDGNWVSGYLPCRFKKGVSVANKTKIKINSAFFVCSKSGDKTYVSLMITNFDVLEQGESAADQTDEFLKIDESVNDEVPFL